MRLLAAITLLALGTPAPAAGAPGAASPWRIPDPLPPCGLAGPGGVPAWGRAAAGGGRPVLSGPEAVHVTPGAGIVVHYTLEGEDALEEAGDAAPPNGVPDQVDAIADGLDRVWEEYVLRDGWEPVRSDGVAGGDSRIDAYVTSLDARGYAFPEMGPDGWSAYLLLDPGSVDYGTEVQASVAGHELHHALQFTYSVSADPWMYESTSTYVQYLGFGSPQLDGAREVLWALRLSEPARSVWDTGEQFEYAAMVWAKFLVDRRGGDREELRRLWEELGEAEGDWRDAHGALVSDQGLQAGDLLAEHAEWNLFACGRDDGAHYLDDPADCGVPARVHVAVAASALPWEGEMGEGAVQPWGVAYAEVPAPEDGGGVLFRCRPRVEGAFRMRAIAVDASGAYRSRGEAVVPEGAGEVEVDGAGPGGQALLAVVNFSGEEAAFDCSAEAVVAAAPKGEDEEGGAGCGGCAQVGAGEPRRGGGAGPLPFLPALIAGAACRRIRPGGRSRA